MCSQRRGGSSAEIEGRLQAIDLSPSPDETTREARYKVEQGQGLGTSTKQCPRFASRCFSPTRSNRDCFLQHACARVQRHPLVPKCRVIRVKVGLLNPRLHLEKGRGSLGCQPFGENNSNCEASVLLSAVPTPHPTILSRASRSVHQA